MCGKQLAEQRVAVVRVLFFAAVVQRGGTGGLEDVLRSVAPVGVAAVSDVGREHVREAETFGGGEPGGVVEQLLDGHVGDGGGGDVDKLLHLSVQAELVGVDELADQLCVECLGDRADFEFGVLVGAEAAEAGLSVVIGEGGEVVVAVFREVFEGGGDLGIAGVLRGHGNIAGAGGEHQRGGEDGGDSSGGNVCSAHQWSSPAITIAMSGMTRAGGISNTPLCLRTQPPACSSFRWW